MTSITGFEYGAVPLETLAVLEDWLEGGEPSLDLLFILCFQVE